MSEKGFGKRNALRFAAILLASTLSYLLLSWMASALPAGSELDSRLADVGGETRVLVSFSSFLVVPVVVLLATGSPVFLEDKQKWGGPFLFYLAVFMVAGGFYYVEPDFYRGFRVDLQSFRFAGWTLLLALRVFPVDFFTKRVVQGEMERLAGPVAGQAAQLLAWLIAHIYEIFWLRPLWGTGGALVFILATGLASGYIYGKGGSAGAFMVFHAVMNIGVALLVSV